MRFFMAFLVFLSTQVYADGPANWPNDIEVPDWWPEQVALYPGTVIKDVDHAQSRGLPDIETYVSAANTDLDSIEQWYRKSQEKVGWEVWKTVTTDHSKRFTSQSKSLDRRIIIQIIKPKQSIFNKSNDYRINIKVYRSIP